MKSADRVKKLRDMSIDDHAMVCVEGVAENDIGGFASHAAELNEGFHCGWDFSGVSLDERAATGLDIFGFIAEEANAPDIFLKLSKRRFGVVFCGPVFFEQIRRDNVDLLVGALGGQNCGDQQFQGTAVAQLAMGVGICPFQCSEQTGNSLLFCLKGLAWHQRYYIG